MKLLLEYIKSTWWTLVRGTVNISIIDSSNGVIIIGEKRGKYCIVDKGHWNCSSMYPRRCDKPEKMTRGKAFEITDGKYTVFDAGAYWETLNLVSYGPARIFVQHEPQYGNHYHVVGRNIDGSFWVAPNFTAFMAITPYERVEGEVGAGLQVFRQGLAVNMSHPEWQTYLIGHTAPLRFIYTMF